MIDKMDAAVRPALPFAKPHIDDNDVAAVVDALRSGWVTTGPRVREFEAAFARTVGARHAVAVSSATAGLHLALDAIGLGEGDEVIVPDVTFTSSAAVVCHCGARPVLVDVVADTLCIDPVSMERAITPRTRAIIVVHLAGHPAEMDQIMDIARRHDLAVIEDVAHAFPSFYHGERPGVLGDIGVFSFYATKTVTTGEGGMVVTDNDGYAERVRTMSLHGMSRDAWKRYTASGSWRYDVVEPGYKYNMTDLSAALGLSQLAKAEWMWQRRKEIAARYSAVFSSYEQLQVPSANQGVDHAWHLYILRLNLDSLACSRDAFIEALRARGIGTSVHFIPLHTFTYYRAAYAYDDACFPVAMREFNRMLSLPIYPSMEDDDVERVIEAVTEVATSGC